MTKSQAMLKALCGAVLTCSAVNLSGCEVAAYPAGYDGSDDYPPADFVATTEPVYFEGRPAYFYHDHWFYRDGSRWGAYAREPPGLAQHRSQFGAPARRNYGRASTVRTSSPRPGRR
jgi:hypothetical protein